jgi:hypothetical protein
MGCTNLTIDHTVKTPTLTVELDYEEQITFVKGTWFEGVADRGEQFKVIKGPNEKPEHGIVAVFLQEKKASSF